MDIELIKVNFPAVYEYVYETLIERCCEIFHLLDMNAVSFAVCWSGEKKEFLFVVTDKRLYFDGLRGQYAYANTALLWPAPDVSACPAIGDAPPKSAEQDYLAYFSLDLNGNVPSYAGRAKRLRTQVRFLKMTEDAVIDFFETLVYANRRTLFQAEFDRAAFACDWLPVQRQLACFAYQGDDVEAARSYARAAPVTAETLFQQDVSMRCEL